MCLEARDTNLLKTVTQEKFNFSSKLKNINIKTFYDELILNEIIKSIIQLTTK